MNRRDLFDRVVAALNDAALNDGLWPSTSRLIDEAVGIKGNALLVTEGPEHDARVLFAAAHYRGQRREDLELDYLENYHLWDERIPRLRRLPNNKVTHVTGLYSQRELKTSRSYNEFSPRSGGRNSLNVRLRGPNGSHITWVILDPVRADWQDAQVGMIERLLPHVRSFVHIRQSLSFASALGSTFGELLEQTSLGVIYLNRRGRVAQPMTARDNSSSGKTACGLRMGFCMHGCPPMTFTSNAWWSRPCPHAAGRPAVALCSSGTLPLCRD